MGSITMCKLEYFCLAVGIVLLLASQLGNMSLYTLLYTVHPNVTRHEIFQTSFYHLLWLLQRVELFVLLYSALKNREHLKFKDVCRNVFCFNFPMCTKKRVEALFVLSVILTTAMGISAIGFYKVTDTAQSWIYELCKFINLVFDSVMWIFVTGLALSTISEWDTPIIISPPKNYNQLYHEKGESTGAARKTLQPWFVIHFIVHLFFVYASLGHIAAPIFKGEKPIPKLVLATLILYLVYNVLGCVLPFMLGTFMNRAHKKFHTRINDLHLQGDSNVQSLEGGTDEDNANNGAATNNELIPAANANNETTTNNGAVSEAPAPAPAPAANVNNETTTNNGAVSEAPAPAANVNNGAVSEATAPVPQRIPFCTDYELKPSLFCVTWPLDTQSPGFFIAIFVGFFALIIDVFAV